MNLFIKTAIASTLFLAACAQPIECDVYPHEDAKDGVVLNDIYKGCEKTSPVQTVTISDNYPDDDPQPNPPADDPHEPPADDPHEPPADDPGHSHDINVTG